MKADTKALAKAAWAIHSRHGDPIAFDDLSEGGVLVRQEQARAALLAFLDPSDEGMVERLALAVDPDAFGEGSLSKLINTRRFVARFRAARFLIELRKIAGETP